MKQLGFFIGHRNYLVHAALLCKSIAENTHIGEEYQIYAVTPKHLDLQVEIPGVTQMNFEIAADYRSMPFVDKMFAAAAFEEFCGDEYIWMEVDSYFFKPLEYRISTEIYANPVDKRNIGDIYGEERSLLWQILFKYFDVADIYPFITTRVTKEKIYPYYSVGMVLINKNRALFHTIKDAICTLLTYDNVKRLLRSSEQNQIYIHQAIFTCALLKLYHKSIKPLPYAVNYPLHLHESTPTPVPFEDIISLRYEDYFEKHNPPLIWKYIFENARKDLNVTWYY